MQQALSRQPWPDAVKETSCCARSSIPPTGCATGRTERPGRPARAVQAARLPRRLQPARPEHAPAPAAAGTSAAGSSTRPNDRQQDQPDDQSAIGTSSTSNSRPPTRLSRRAQQPADQAEHGADHGDKQPAEPATAAGSPAALRSSAATSRKGRDQPLAMLRSPMRRWSLAGSPAGSGLRTDRLRLRAVP